MLFCRRSGNPLFLYNIIVDNITWQVLPDTVWGCDSDTIQKPACELLQIAPVDTPLIFLQCVVQHLHKIPAALAQPLVLNYFRRIRHTVRQLVPGGNFFALLNRHGSSLWRVHSVYTYCNIVPSLRSFSYIGHITVLGRKHSGALESGRYVEQTLQRIHACRLILALRIQVLLAACSADVF